MNARTCPKCQRSIDINFVNTQGSFLCVCGAKLRISSQTGNGQKPASKAKLEGSSATNSDEAIWNPLPLGQSYQAGESVSEPLDLNLPAFSDAANVNNGDWKDVVSTFESKAFEPFQNSSSSNSIARLTASKDATIGGSTKGIQSKALATRNRLLTIGACVTALAIICLLAFSYWLGNRLYPNERGIVVDAPVDGMETKDGSSAIVRMESSDRFENLVSAISKKKEKSRELEAVFHGQIELPKTVYFERHTLPAMSVPPLPLEDFSVADTTDLRNALASPHSSALLPREGNVVLVRREKQNPRKIVGPLDPLQKQGKLRSNEASLFPIFENHQKAVLEVVDVRTGTVLGEYLSNIVPENFSYLDRLRHLAPDGKTMLAHSEWTDKIYRKRRINVYHIENFKTFSWIDCPYPIEWYDYLNADTILALGFRDSEACFLLISIKQNKVLKEIPCPGAVFRETDRQFHNRERDTEIQHRPHSIAIHPSRRWVAVTGNGKLTIVNLVEATCTGPIELSVAGVKIVGAGFSPDGRELLGRFGYTGHLLYRWSLHDGSLNAINDVSWNEKNGSDWSIEIIGNEYLKRALSNDRFDCGWRVFKFDGQVIAQGKGCLGNRLNEREYFIYHGDKLSVIDIKKPEFETKQVVKVDPRNTISALTGTDIQVTTSQSTTSWEFDPIPRLERSNRAKIFMPDEAQAWAEQSCASAKLGSNIVLHEWELSSGKYSERVLFESRFPPHYKVILDGHNRSTEGKIHSADKMLIAMTWDGRQIALADSVGTQITILDEVRKPTVSFQIPMDTSTSWIGFVDNQILAVLTGDELWGIDVANLKVIYRLDGK